MKKTIIVLLVLCVGFSAFAEFHYSPAIDGFLGGSFLHGTAEYLQENQGKKLPFFRTSFTAGFDAMVLNCGFGKLDIGAGYSMFWTSQSLPAGVHIIQPYYGLGFAIGVHKSFEKTFGIGLKGRLLFCNYKPYNYKFDIVEVEAIPSFKVVESKGANITLLIPVTCSIKADAVSMKVQAGFRVNYPITFPQKNKEVENEKN